MDRAHAKELAPIIQAFADGKIVQYRLPHDEEWNDICISDWSWDVSRYTYRIKPEPKTRPMTRGEVLYILSSEHLLMRYNGGDPFIVIEAIGEHEQWVDDAVMRNIDLYEYTRIDEHGDPIGEWKKFEVTV